jgi:mRNA interferase MazF
LDPQAGHKQAGRRPALALSPAAFNEKTGFAVFCPVTSTLRADPFSVWVPDECKITGAILVDQLKSLDWKARRAEFVEALPGETLKYVRNLVARILNFPVES